VVLTCLTPVVGASALVRLTDADGRRLQVAGDGGVPFRDGRLAERPER